MKRWVYAGLLLAIIIFLSWIIFKPSPQPEPIIIFQKEAKGEKPNLSLNGTVSQTLKVGNNNLILENNSNEIRPIASTAKLILALLVLQQKPLSVEDKIIFNQEDVKLTQRMAAQSQSYLPILAGQSLNQYQALEALLMMSANNVAVKLSNLAFGSEEEYIKQANDFLIRNGITNTKVADASGFSNDTKSTSNDMLKITELALNNEVIKKIVAQKTTELPNYGTVNNTNSLLGVNGINGAKTGYTGAAGGSFVYSANINNIKIIGSIFGAETRNKALSEALNNSNLINQKINEYTAIYQGQPIAIYFTNQGNVNTVKIDKNIEIKRWGNEEPKISVNLINPSNNSQRQVEIVLESSVERRIEKIDLYLDEAKPSIFWRLTNLL